MNSTLEKPVQKGLVKPRKEEKRIDVNRENWPSYTVPMKHHIKRKPLSPKQLEILHLVRMYVKAKSYTVKGYIQKELLRITDSYGYDLLYGE